MEKLEVFLFLALVLMGVMMLTLNPIQGPIEASIYPVDEAMRVETSLSVSFSGFAR